MEMLAGLEEKGEREDKRKKAGSPIYDRGQTPKWKKSPGTSFEKVC